MQELPQELGDILLSLRVQAEGQPANQQVKLDKVGFQVPSESL